MSRGRPGDPLHVVLTMDFPAPVLEQLRAVDSRVVLHSHPGGGPVPGALLAQAEVLYTSELLPGRRTAPNLRWVQLDTSGVDHVQDSELWRSDAVLTTLGGISPGPLAEWVLMMVLAHAHHLRETEALAVRQEWPTRTQRWTTLMPTDLRRSTIGIVGYGRIGREIARLAQAFGMQVLAVRRDSDAAPAAPAETAAGPVNGRFGEQPALEGVRAVGPDGLHAVLAASDYVAVTVPLTAQTRDLIGPAELAVMKPGSVLVNASRGGVVDEVALLAALDSGRLDQVASDVFTTEPLPPGHRLWSHPRSVVTPHIAGFAPDYHDVVTQLFGQNLRRYLDGSPLLNVADRDRGY